MEKVTEQPTEIMTTNRDLYQLLLDSSSSENGDANKNTKPEMTIKGSLIVGK